MKCKNPITIAHYNNGKTVIEGSQSVMIPRIERYELDKSINGYYEHCECNGNIEISIFCTEANMGEDCGSVDFEFRCDRCGIRHELDYSIEDIEKIVNNHI